MEKNELNISGVLNLNYLPLVKFDHLKLITGSGRECSIDGEVGEKKWDFIAIGKNMDIFATAELFGLTVPCEGSMNVNFTGKGTTERPEIEAAVDMSNGSISEIPFDNINLQLSSHHDVMTVVKAKLAKKNLFSITVSGFSPFALTDTGIKRIHNNPIDISVTVEEGTLSMLKVFSNDIIGAKGSRGACAHDRYCF
jgi:hypothetical protein